MQVNAEELREKAAERQEKRNITELDTYFKYFSDDSRVIKGIFEDQKIRFTQPRALNDPLEFNPTILFNDPDKAYQSYDLDGVLLPSIELFFRVQIIESQINYYGILSLTKIPDSFDMWSQYSNGHKGFIIEFKPDFWQHPSMKSKEGEEYPVRKVEYVDNYSINLEEMADESGNIFLASVHDELFYKKTSRWEHEKEYRMVRPLTDAPEYNAPSGKYSYAYTELVPYLFPFDIECISSIILGANMSVENKQLISRFCENHNIPYFQVFLLRDCKDRFNKPTTVRILSVDDLGDKHNILNPSPQVFCTETIKLGHRTTKKINDIKELPYYELYPEVVDQLYANLIEARKSNDS
jgi:hypothetical protein